MKATYREQVSNGNEGKEVPYDSQCGDTRDATSRVPLTILASPSYTLFMSEPTCKTLGIGDHKLNCIVQCL